MATALCHTNTIGTIKTLSFRPIRTLAENYPLYHMNKLGFAKLFHKFHGIFWHFSFHHILKSAIDKSHVFGSVEHNIPSCKVNSWKKNGPRLGTLKMVAKTNQHPRMATHTCSFAARTCHLQLSSPSVAVNIWAKLVTLFNTFTIFHPSPASPINRNFAMAPRGTKDRAGTAEGNVLADLKEASQLVLHPLLSHILISLSGACVSTKCIIYVLWIYYPGKRPRKVWGE